MSLIVKVTFQQRLKDVKEGATGMFGERTFQAEQIVKTEDLRLLCPLVFKEQGDRETGAEDSRK